MFDHWISQAMTHQILASILGKAVPSFEWPIPAFFPLFLPKSLGICPFVPEQRAHSRRWGSARLCPGREPIFDQAFQPPRDFAVDWGRDISVTTTFQSTRLFSLQFPFGNWVRSISGAATLQSNRLFSLQGTLQSIGVATFRSLRLFSRSDFSVSNFHLEIGSAAFRVRRLCSRTGFSASKGLCSRLGSRHFGHYDLSVEHQFGDFSVTRG